MSLQNDVIDATREIFSTMLMIDVEVEGDITDQGVVLSNNITGMVGFGGTAKGVLALHFGTEVAAGVTAAFLGMEPDQTADDIIDDAIGELANMLGGGVKGMLSENGRDIDLSLPSIIRGKDYQFQCNKNAARTVIPFSCSVGHFFVELQLEG